jgi:hypothetical protein
MIVMLLHVQNSQVKKKCVTVRCCDEKSVLLSPKFWANSSHLACQDKFFMNSPLNSKEIDEHVNDFLLHFPLGG